MQTEQALCCGSGHGRASLGQGKRHTRREASCQIRTERRTKASFKKVERSTHGPVRPVHTVSSEEEDVRTSTSNTTTFISKFAGSSAWYPKGFKAVKQGWVNITKSANLHSKTAVKPTIFVALLHKTGMSVFISSMASGTHGLPEEPLIEQEGLLCLIEKKMTMSRCWVVTGISGERLARCFPSQKEISGHSS